MEHSIQVSGNRATVVLQGKMYVHEAGVLRDELVAKIEQGVTQLHLDLAGVGYIDSSGLGVLVTLHKLTQEVQGGLVLKGVQGMVGELLKRTRLDKVLRIE